MPLSRHAQAAKDDALGRAASIFELRVVPSIKERHKAVDIGSGKGNTAIVLSKYFETVYSIDTDEQILSEARRATDNAGIKNVTFQLMDAHRLAFEDESVDFVACRAAIHHFDDPRVVLGEIKRILRPTGAVCVMDFCFSAATKAILTPISMIRESDFRQYFTFHEFCELFESEGFMVETIYTYTLPRLVSEWASGLPESVREGVIRGMDTLPYDTKKELRLETGSEGMKMTYRIVEILCTKE